MNLDGLHEERNLPGSSYPDQARTEQGNRRILGVLVAVMVAIFALYIAAHVVPAVMVRDSPPLACQIAGGQWSIWNGWACG